MADDIIKPDPSFDIAGTGAATPSTSSGQAPAPEPVAQTAPVAPIKTPEQLEEERKIAAKLAMEGPERTARREEQEKARHAKEEKADLEKRLAVIAKQKEKLELAWVDLDEQRKKLKTTLAPILEQEKAVEAEETAAEDEEEKSGLPKEKHLVEEKRWVIQQKRKQVEDEKWKIQEKVVKLEELIETNTNDYRSLLDEEDKINQKIDDLNASVL